MRDTSAEGVHAHPDDHRFLAAGEGPPSGGGRLLRIPPGALASYGRVGEAAFGTSRGARAIGAAVGDNPISYLVPCHRVVRSSGALNDYHWGRARKLALIGWEAARAEGGPEAEIAERRDSRV